MKKSLKILLSALVAIIVCSSFAGINEVLAADVSFETFITSVKAGEFVLSDATYEKFIDYVEAGDTDNAMEIYKAYFHKSSAKANVESAEGSADDVSVTEPSDDSSQAVTEVPEVVDAVNDAATSDTADAEVPVKKDVIAVEAVDNASLDVDVTDLPVADADTELTAPAAETVAETVVQTTEISVADYHGLTMQDYFALCKMVQAEAPGEGIVGKQMVANVILNRVKSPFFPATVTAVISERGQFSPYGSGKYHATVPTPETMEAVNKALDGENNAVGMLYFRRARSSTAWGSRVYAGTYGNHMFYF